MYYTQNIHVLPLTYHILYIKHTHITNNLPRTTHKHTYIITNLPHATHNIHVLPITSCTTHKTYTYYQ